MPRPGDSKNSPQDRMRRTRLRQARRTGRTGAPSPAKAPAPTPGGSKTGKRARKTSPAAAALQGQSHETHNITKTRGQSRRLAKAVIHQFTSLLAASGDPRIRTYKATSDAQGNIVLSRWIIPPGIHSPEPDPQQAFWTEYLRVCPVKTEFGLEYLRHDGHWHLLVVASRLREIADYILDNEYGLF